MAALLVSGAAAKKPTGYNGIAGGTQGLVQKGATKTPTDVRARRGECSRRGAHGPGAGALHHPRIVRAHGGTLRVTSTEADGTRFWMSLPRYASA